MLKHGQWRRVAMCSCCCDNTEEKDYEKEEKTQDMGSAYLQRKREIWCIIFS